MAACAATSGHLDTTTFVDRCVTGFQMVGHLPETHCHRLKPFSTTKDATVNRDSPTKRLIASITHKGKKATAREIIDRHETLQATLLEVEDGLRVLSLLAKCTRTQHGFWLAHRSHHRCTPTPRPPGSMNMPRRLSVHVRCMLMMSEWYNPWQQSIRSSFLSSNSSPLLAPM